MHACIYTSFKSCPIESFSSIQALCLRVEVRWTPPPPPSSAGPMGGSLARREPGGERLVAGGVGLRSGRDITSSSITIGSCRELTLQRQCVNQVFVYVRNRCFQGYPDDNTNIAYDKITINDMTREFLCTCIYIIKSRCRQRNLSSDRMRGNMTEHALSSTITAL